MALLKVLKYPDPRLRHPAVAVETVDAAVQQLVSDMLETMYDHNGVGLAATQVNIQKRVVVMDISHSQHEPIVLINPEITASEGQVKSKEGCLSVPGVYEDVKRCEQIEVKALDREGNVLEFDADGLLAECIQHEIDHLDGKLFIDYLSPLKQKLVRAKLEKIRRRNL